MHSLKSFRLSVRWCLCTFAAFLIGSTLCGQSPQGEIRLVVKDSSSAPMQASGKLENTALGVSREFQTDAQGVMVLPQLPFGRYHVQISKSGFTTQSIAIA